MAVATLILFSVICGLAFYFTQMRLRLIHRKISIGTKKDLFLILVFLPVNLLIVFGPHFLLIIVEAWQEIGYGRLVLLIIQIMAAVSVVMVLRKTNLMQKSPNNRMQSDAAEPRR